MSREQTAAEVQQEYVGAMGPELGSVFFEFRNECITLHWKWEEYIALFGTSQQRIDLLNQAAGAFFRVVQDTLWADVLLQIARLTDPVQSAGKDNLTLRRLPELVVPEIRPKVTELLQACLDRSEFARDWRRRQIAHRDLALALEHPGVAPLAPASRKHVKKALAAIVELLNAVLSHYLRQEAVYEVRPLGNAVSLLYVLRDGLKAEEDRVKRVKSGNYGPGDVGPWPAI